MTVGKPEPADRPLLGFGAILPRLALARDRWYTYRSDRRIAAIDARLARIRAKQAEIDRILADSYQAPQ